MSETTEVRQAIIAISGRLEKLDEASRRRVLEVLQSMYGEEADE